MEIQTKLKALARLVESSSEAAQAALRKEIESSAKTLQSSSSYDDLEVALDILREIGFRESATTTEAISEFIVAVEQRKLTHPEELLKISGSIEQYRNAETLIAKAIEAIGRLRYLETKPVFKLLLYLTAHGKERVSKKALQELESIASYDIGVFYGRAGQSGIGAEPQMQLLDEIEKLGSTELQAHFGAIVSTLVKILSPTMGGSTWSYRAVTISKAPVPAITSIGAVRDRSIGLLIRLFDLSSTSAQRAQIIGALHSATRSERASVVKDDALDVFSRDTQRVLDFYAKIAATADMPLVQKIEHDSYWIHYHGISKEVKQAALRVRDVINGIPEYQIYKVLVGFEGVFENWEAAKKDGGFSENTRLRRELAREFARSISEENYEEWKERILRYCAIESNDLATFQIFYDFLDELGKSNATIGLKLLQHHAESLSRVLVSLLVGLWKGEGRPATVELIQAWLTQGRFLRHSMRLFWDNPENDLGLARKILARAIELNDVGTIRDAVTAVISNYTPGSDEPLEAILSPSLQELSNHKDSSWIFDNWYRPELKVLTENCAEPILERMVESLRFVRRVDYQLEEVLYLVALRMPGLVVDYFIGRAAKISVADEALSEQYEGLPFELNKVNQALASHAGLVVSKFRSAYDGNYSNSVVDGGRFLTRIYPAVTPELERELLALVERNTAADTEFVLSILRNYEGQPFIHGVCKAIVRKLPIESRLVTEVRISLYTTGVVSGELGFASAYERKVEEIRSWLDDPHPKIKEFAASYIADLSEMALQERERAKERTTLERHRYGLGGTDPASE